MIRLRVKEVAEAKGIGQLSLSRHADLNLRTLHKIYRQPESANITLDTLNRLANALGVDAKELFDYMPDD